MDEKTEYFIARDLFYKQAARINLPSIIIGSLFLFTSLLVALVNLIGGALLDIPVIQKYSTGLVLLQAFCLLSSFIFTYLVFWTQDKVGKHFTIFCKAGDLKELKENKEMKSYFPETRDNNQK